MLTRFQMCFVLTILYVSPDVHIQAKKSSTGENPYHKRLKVVNKFLANDSISPYMVSIQSYKTKLNVCGGSLLTISHVLTACHCLMTHKQLRPIGHFYAAAGASLLSSPDTQIRGFTKFIVHAECDVVVLPFVADIGMAIVKGFFNLSGHLKLVRFISLKKDTLQWWYNHFVRIGKVCHTAGWGKSKLCDCHPPTALRDGLVKLISEEDCKYRTCSYYNYCVPNLLNKRQMCAVPYNGSATCEGDSGGPVLCDEYIFGLISVGTTKCSSDLPKNHAPELPMIFCDYITVLDFVRYLLPDYKVDSDPGPPDRLPLSKYPFVVSIANVTNPRVVVSICSGSILNASSVVTTATCLKKLTFSNETEKYIGVAVISRINEHHGSSSCEQRLSIVRVAINERMLPDVGIAFVDGEFPLDKPKIQTLQFFPSDFTKIQSAFDECVRKTNKCSMATWAYDIEHPTEINYNIFSEWPVQLYSVGMCQNTLCKDDPSLCEDTLVDSINTVWCGVAFNVNRSCFADTGGPLVYGGYFFGLVSFNGDLCKWKNTIKITSLSAVYNFVVRGIDSDSGPIETKLDRRLSNSVYHYAPEIGLICVSFLLYTILWE